MQVVATAPAKIALLKLILFRCFDDITPFLSTLVLITLRLCNLSHVDRKLRTASRPEGAESMILQAR